MSRRVTCLALAVLGLLVTTGCAGKASEGEPEVCSPKHAGEPCASAEVGVEYPVVLLSHCGVGWAYFAGRFWVIDPPQPEGANVVRGFMTLVSGDKLIQFRGDDGRQYAFKPAPSSFSPPPCA